MIVKDKQVKTKVWGGIVILFLYNGIITAIINILVENNIINTDSGNSIKEGFIVVTTAAAVAYGFIAKKYHFDRTRKLLLLVGIFIFLNLGGFIIGKYNYGLTPTIVQRDQFFEKLRELNLNERKVETSKFNTTITTLTFSIQDSPRDTQEVNKYLIVLDSLLDLHKRSYGFTKEIYDTMLSTLNNITSTDTKFLINRELLEIAGMNMGVLPRFNRQYAVWYQSVQKNL